MFDRFFECPFGIDGGVLNLVFQLLVEEGILKKHLMGFQNVDLGLLAESAKALLQCLQLKGGLFQRGSGSDQFTGDFGFFEAAFGEDEIFEGSPPQFPDGDSGR